MDMNKDGSLKLSLVADSGYEADAQYRISADQWGDVIRVCEGTLSSQPIAASPLIEGK